MTEDAGNLLILGAGFSFNAGLPLASGFTKELLRLDGRKSSGPSARQVAFLEEFVKKVFSEGVSASHDQWPELEDIFTSVDLSANTGHHLGPDYSASDLRVVRRAILVRTIRMLDWSRRHVDPARMANRKALDGFFARFDATRSAVLSMNWDTVFEQGLKEAQDIGTYDYGCDAIPATFKNGEVRRRKVKGESATILKPHGSVNWLYCDACRETFWFDPKHMEQVAQTLFRQKDWATVKASGPDCKVLEPDCPRCGAKSLGTRFATFSYRKALEFPMHAASWRTAEKLLKGAVDWVFFGYSMPSADFEFKHLLKRVQLSERIRPNIALITGGTDAGPTVERFKRFFGEVAGSRTFFTNGLDAAALSHLEKIEVLKAGSMPRAKAPTPAHGRKRSP